MRASVVADTVATMTDQRDGGIGWCDETWNPIRGCSRVNESCINCYAERVAVRFSKPGLAYQGLVRLSKKEGQVGKPLGWNGVVRLVPEHLADPLRWKRPRRIFTNSMSDLFHEALTFETIAAIFGVMAAAPRHTFQCLTKRPARMREWFQWIDVERAKYAPAWHSTLCIACAQPLSEYRVPSASMLPMTDAWPLPNVHLGVSVGNQDEADAFIPILLETPAAIRWVSYEPAHGPVNFAGQRVNGTNGSNWLAPTLRAIDSALDERPGLDWIVVGGESGKGARPFDIAWARSTVEQCKAAGVACFVKQLGANAIVEHAYPAPSVLTHCSVALVDRSGADPSEWPADLRVQEFPA